MFDVVAPSHGCGPGFELYSWRILPQWVPVPSTKIPNIPGSSFHLRWSAQPCIYDFDDASLRFDPLHPAPLHFNGCHFARDSNRPKLRASRRPAPAIRRSGRRTQDSAPAFGRKASTKNRFQSRNQHHHFQCSIHLQQRESESAARECGGSAAELEVPRPRDVPLNSRFILKMSLDA